jgi:hypothetical protein
MNNYDSTKDTLDHIELVRLRMKEITDNLEARSKVHDASKLESPEKEVFDRVTPKLRKLTYGSDEYKESLLEMGDALKHHYRVNSHHPEHNQYAECDICFERYPENYDGRCNACMNGTFTLRPDINKMTLLDIIEMLADWKAATERHADGDFKRSLEINRKRFEISEQLYQIIENMACELKWI